MVDNAVLSSDTSYQEFIDWPGWEGRYVVLWGSDDKAFYVPVNTNEEVVLAQDWMSDFGVDMAFVRYGYKGWSTGEIIRPYDEMVESEERFSW